MPKSNFFIVLHKIVFLYMRVYSVLNVVVNCIYKRSSKVCKAINVDQIKTCLAQITLILQSITKHARLDPYIILNFDSTLQLFCVKQFLKKKLTSLTFLKHSFQSFSWKIFHKENLIRNAIENEFSSVSWKCHKFCWLHFFRTLISEPTKNL